MTLSESEVERRISAALEATARAVAQADAASAAVPDPSTVRAASPVELVLPARSPRAHRQVRAVGIAVAACTILLVGLGLAVLLWHGPARSVVPGGGSTDRACVTSSAPASSGAASSGAASSGAASDCPSATPSSGSVSSSSPSSTQPSGDMS